MTRKQPLVSCIMPTYNRREFVPLAINYFFRQEYEHKELIIIDDGTDAIGDIIPDHPAIRYFYLDKKITLGAKLNLACKYATGDIIVNWDDDDWYASRRLAYQVDAMGNPETDVCGINKLLYYDVRSKEAWQYIYPSNQRTWLLGSSLCYTRKRWNSNQFADIDVGMDGLFVWATPPARVHVLEDYSFSVHMIHDRNVSPKNTKGGWWHTYPVGTIEQIMRNDWELYQSGFSAIKKNYGSPAMAIPPPASNFRKIQNVYACLVHESKDCIIDLISNLHYHDPTSFILLYNGSDDPLLIPDTIDFAHFNVMVVPDPVPAKHGYLHHFALHCMQFALKRLSYDTLTIVDSDQLAIRSGYSEYLSDFFSSRTNVGMLSSMPDRITADQRMYTVANQGFAEYELWKPLLQRFPDGENKFVHWTFWPSTVFTSDAVRDLVNLFEGDEQLQDIMQKTKIWATEEVVFPTLVRLLGYDIVLNPCSYEYVKYRKNYTPEEITRAMHKQNVYWIHPVERKYDHPLRKYTRQRFNKYEAPGNLPLADGKKLPQAPATSLIDTIKKIAGWLGDGEAQLLIDTTKRVFRELPAPLHIVEVGSYQGRSTVLFGSMINEYFPGGKVYAIDPHDGRLGAEDTGLHTVVSSWVMFRKNISTYGLDEVVEVIRDRAFNVDWKKPVSLLFIDGLHDYQNVSRDFSHFCEWVVQGGYVAFHDYAPYFPGVMRFVDELLDTGTFVEVQREQSLVVVKKG